MEHVHYFEGWVEGAKSLWCQGFAYRQPHRTGGRRRQTSGHRIGEIKKNILNVENLVKMKEKTSLLSILKGDLPTCSSFNFSFKIEIFFQIFFII